jgi:hypothetical protein
MMRAYGATFHGGGSASGIRDQLISTRVYFSFAHCIWNFLPPYGIAT